MTAILITGGSGYVGGRLARHLLTRGHDIRLASRRPLSPIWAKDARTIVLDWDDPASVAAACAGCRTVVHLAGLSDAECARDPIQALRINGEYTIRLLEAAITAGCRRFVLFSTAHVYGARLNGVVDETTLPLPRHPYGISNRVAEDFVLAAHAQGRIGALALRLSNAIGAPVHADIDRWGLLVNDLCRAAAAGGPLVMRSSGLVSRDFIPLADVENALAHLLTLPPDAWGDGLMNLGSGHSTSAAAMADLVLARARAKGLIVALQRPAPAPGETAAPLEYRIDRLRACGFTPQADLAAAIDETLDFCLAQAKATP
ncbi:putative UDP-glucose 4-epimerase [Magnetospirillum gryphiswaldense MSR-1 v2]|uniref:UDP-glucose 4-epimerase n=1 Tax=Magnetospirillum gryphiswaldense (strain DSM 6361 / JCM 21280 / NBRC 15271 / MSR-1) TaxID=431944 RepID=V6F894_MAGGM|nr:SDR family oxidoreductase [Magnetospirillum gryphiswaldense]CDL00611.1 putative UDP-glucose 4-epimerase [Magnetospirillum gryphiswaldense MSR-1 v2]